MQTRNILQFLEATVARVPDKTAFANDTEGLTFGELSRAAKGVGSYILKQGITKQPVIVYMEKHPNEMAAFFGCMYAGCPYVPIDAEMPLFRIELIANTLNPALVICDEAMLASAHTLFGEERVVPYDSICTEPVDEEALAAVRAAQIDTDPVYIVFTSGSTGIPKGVIGCHRAVIDYAENIIKALPFDEDSIFANQSPLYFDAPLKEILPTILFGATMYFVPRQFFLFPMQLCDFLNRHKVNTLCWVVSALTMISSMGVLEKNPPKYLRLVAFGSEVFPIKQFNLWRKALPEARFFNLYGPTECTGMSCYYEVKDVLPEDQKIPIGRPFENTDAFLLDEEGKKIPFVPGEVSREGELYLRGTCVTLGYFRNPEQTRAAFVQNPLQDMYPETVYRTGDIACYKEDGNLLFLSRKDHQIKHMGHRLELGEIEAAAERMDGITRACCLYDADKKKIHITYTGTAESKDVKAFLKEKLPRYMLPNGVHPLETFPLTPNGKLDRQELKRMFITIE